MIKTSTTLLLIITSFYLSAQKNVRSFIFGHSLINHEFQINPTPSQETSVPHWIHFLAKEANNEYAVSGQYGFLPQHANLPPIAQWGFENVTGAWDSDNEPFSAADFTNVLITPGNFIQWQGPGQNYPTDNTSPIEATIDIIQWCTEQEESLSFYIYENWPDMAEYLNNGFPPSGSEWANYNNYLNGDFHNWFISYHDLVKESFPNACVQMIPVGPVISKLLLTPPFANIEIEELYEDDAPHGRPTIYFLAALTTYMAMYEEKAPLSFEVPSIIDPIIVDNYSLVVDLIWTELNSFRYSDDDSRVFCGEDLISPLDEKVAHDGLSIYPNPTGKELTIKTDFGKHYIEIYSMDGQLSMSLKDQDTDTIDISSLASGVYLVVGRSLANDILYAKRLFKI